MDVSKIINLIQFIICYGAEQDIKLTTIRLVKFMYLADLYHARWFGGKTLTGLPWAFVYYGPYCTQVMAHIDDAVSKGFIFEDVRESRYKASKDYSLFSCPDQKSEALENLFPIPVTSGLKEAIKTLGDDTAALLDYIYFGTEPMMEARPGDLLNFSKAIIHEPPKETIKKLSQDKIELGRKYARILAKNFKTGQEKLKEEAIQTEKFKDETYYRAIDYFEEEDLQIGLDGKAEIIE